MYRLSALKTHTKIDVCATRTMLASTLTSVFLDAEQTTNPNRYIYVYGFDDGGRRRRRRRLITTIQNISYIL